MSQEPYLLITADSHGGGGHAAYREYLDPKYRAAFDEWRGAYRNPEKEHFGNRKLRNWDFDIRSNEQNSQGVVGEVIFPNTVPPFWRKALVMPPSAIRPEDYELYMAGIRAHNRWLKDFCAEDSVRRAGVGVILPNDLDDAVKEIEFIGKAGLRGGVLMPLVPPDATWLKPLYDPAWDRVYAALQDHDLVMNHHAGAGVPEYGESLVGQALWATDAVFYSQAGYRQMLLSGVFERFPNLKLIVTESGCAWAVQVLQQLDSVHETIRRGGAGEVKFAGDWVLKEPPSEYARRCCFYGASFPSKAELDGIDLIGEDNVLWGNDYPHYEGTYPYTLESLRLSFGAISEERRRKLFGLNAVKLYKFDLEALKPLAAKFGPTPDQVNQPIAIKDLPHDTLCYLFNNAIAADAAKAA